MVSINKITLLLGIFLLFLSYQPLASTAATPATKPKKSGFFDGGSDKVPTFIKATSLTLKSEQRFFVYTGNVEVKHGDMTLTSNTLEGTYNEKNEIQQLTAKQNVFITKGPDIKARGERAVYEKATDTMTLTENPELEQEGNVLTADVIKIFLSEDRSTAEGEVRVKLISKEGESTKTSLPIR